MCKYMYIYICVYIYIYVCKKKDSNDEHQLPWCRDLGAAVPKEHRAGQGQDLPAQLHVAQHVVAPGAPGIPGAPGSPWGNHRRSPGKMGYFTKKPGNSMDFMDRLGLGTGKARKQLEYDYVLLHKYGGLKTTNLLFQSCMGNDSQPFQKRLNPLLLGEDADLDHNFSIGDCLHVWVQWSTFG